MKRYLIFILLLLISTSSSLLAQKPTPTPAVEKDDEVVRISTSLVQLDAVVVDKSGNPVKDLTAADFQLFQDGKRQPITNITYISRGSRDTTGTDGVQTQKKPEKGAPLPPPASSKGTGFGRVLTFVVDDGNCSASQLGMIALKEGLEKFVLEQMLPDDSVAIYQTRAGSPLLQQYTSDKSRLMAQIRKIRWYPPDGVCASGDGSFNAPIRNDATEKPQSAALREAIELRERDRQIAGVIGVSRYAINGLKNIGGRKILFIMSDSLPIWVGKKETTQVSRAFEAIKDLAEVANRASVVVSTIDVRGSSAPGLQAADDPEGIKMAGAERLVDTMLDDRNRTDNQRQSGLIHIAKATGGSFFKEMNKLDVPIKQALKQESGYYLLGYEPDDETFNGKEFHKIEIKLQRPDLKISSRSGFFGVTDEQLRSKNKTGDSELYEALASPLANANLNVRVTAHFANSQAKGNFIRAILHIDGRDITFAEGTEGKKKLSFDIVAVTLDDKNKVVDDSNSSQTLQIPLANVEEIRRSGLIYSVEVPVRKEGVYSFRTALRDAGSGRIGSASQVIEVPELKKGKLYISGLTLSGVSADGKLISAASSERNVFSTVVSGSVPAIRKFARNTIVGYSYTIYNAKPDSATGQPKLTIQTNLFRDGVMVVEGTPQPAQLEKQSDPQRINDYGYLKLNPGLLIGDYAIQIVIRDLQTNQTSSQWIDFEVIE